MKRIYKHIFCMIVMFLATTLAQAEEIAELRKTLNEPISVNCKNNKSYYGYGHNFTTEGFDVTAIIDSGEIIYFVKKEDILSMELPGEEYKKLANILINKGIDGRAEKILASLFAHRAKYFPYAQEEDILFFAIYMDLLMEQRNYINAGKVAKKMRAYITHEDSLNHIRDIELLISYKRGFDKKLQEQIGNWLNHTSPFHRSAIGWWLASKSQYENKHYEEALWTCLYPITFSSQVPTPWLNHCYVVAIASHKALKNEKQAGMLLEEMQERHLSWPDEMPEFDYLKPVITLSSKNNEATGMPEVEEMKQEFAPEPEPEPELKRILPLKAPYTKTNK